MNTDQTRLNPGSDGAVSQTDAPDLQSQLEALLNAVWERERWARTEDRIDAAVRYGDLGRSNRAA
jgi:hypothetical protein